MKNFIKPLMLSCALSSIALSSIAQIQGDVYRQSDVATVSRNGNDIPLAWSGGVNNPQFAMADLNRDGRTDIVVFEDYARVIKTYICTAPGKYKYDSKYESSFNNVQGYLKLIDFNRDNIPDLVHRGQSGVSISYGYYQDNILRFKFYKELYYYSGVGAGWVNCYVAPGDIPGMADVDGDGDIDIFAYRVLGTQIMLYRNCTVEDNLPLDSIKICLKDECWGRTFQDYQREQYLGVPCWQDGTTCKGCPEPEAKATHGSNTLCMIDIDNDGDLDYFNGNQDYEDIQFLYNGKAQYGVDSVIAQDTAWKSKGVTMNVPIFPGAYYLNVDHDGATDLVFSATAYGSENHSVVFYKNTGTNANKVFEFQTDQFLLDDMIDLGIGSYPIFYDYDKDGKKDLIIGSEGYYQYPANENISRLSLYKNTSTGKDNFSFEFVTDDFLNLSAKNYHGIAPAIGDIDNDTLDDLIIGHKDGTFSFYKNVAQSDTSQPIWQLAKDTMYDGRTGKVMDVGDYATPCLYDINGDGRKDLVSGNQWGELYFYSNYGTVPGFVGFEYKTDSLGGIGIKDLYEPYTYTAPYIGPTDDDGKDYLVIGTFWGELYRYTGFQNGANPAKYTLMDTVYSYLNVGKRAAPAFANLDNDNVGLHELVAGNLLGGVSFFRQFFKVGINDVNAVSNNVQVYPNPASNVINVSWDVEAAKGGVTVQLVSVTGQTVFSQQYGADIYNVAIPLDRLSSGVYYCTVHTSAGKAVKPVSVIK